MLQPLTCIALRTVRLNEKQNMLTVWSREAGRITLAMPSGPGREACRRRALTRPLDCFEGVVNVRPDREVYTMRDLRPYGPVASARLGVIKDMIAMFLAEVLDHLLRQAAPDALLSDFLFESTAILHEAETEELTGYFIPVFLMRLTEYLGVGPDMDSAGDIFDLREGRFRTALPMHRDFAEGSDGADLRELFTRSFGTAPALGWSRVRRNSLTDILLRYLSIHIAPLGNLKTREIFGQ